MDLEQSVSKQTHVSTRLATHLLLSNKFHKSNVVFSPLSIHVALSLLAAGSKGPTRDQLLAFLKVNSAGDLNSLYSRLVPLIVDDESQSVQPMMFAEDQIPPKVSIANGVWVEKTLSLKPSFKEVVDTAYKGACNQVDFKNKADEVANEVNLWAEKQTNGLIKEVLPDDAVNSSTRLILANAVYFKAMWREPFDRENTRDCDFHLLDDKKVQVPFMSNGGGYQLINKHDDFKVLGLPYVNRQDKRRFTMYFCLPNEKDGLRSLVEKIGSTSDFLEKHIPRQSAKVGKLRIPKFKISFGFQASNILKELGLVLPFNSGNGDDFSEIFDLHDGEPHYVSSIYHKSFVEVNEEGTEAAAITVEELCGCSLDYIKEVSIDFVADHPFLFLIREDVTGVVLFMGQVLNPSVG